MLITVSLALATLPIGLFIGFMIALGKQSEEWTLRISAEIYTTIFRGLPELLTLFIVYYGLQIGIQLLLKEINTNSLMVALKGSDEKLKEKFLRNMSTRAATLLREDMEASGPIRVSQVESEQKAILQVVRRLADSGEIVLTGGDDAYV